MFAITAEREVVCTTTDLVNAFSALIAVHYTFDFTYVPKARNTLTFIQKVILNMGDGTSFAAFVLPIFKKFKQVAVIAFRI